MHVWSRVKEDEGNGVGWSGGLESKGVELAMYSISICVKS